MTIQRVYRRGSQSTALARRLIAASQQVAPSVRATTIYNDELGQPVEYMEAEKSMKVGNVILVPGSHYYMVESERFAGYYYVAIFNQESKTWHFSGEAKLATKYIEKAKAYHAEAPAA